MYKVMLPCLVIVSCFVFFLSAQAISETQASPAQTDCDKLHNCTECLESTLNCTFCVTRFNNGTCMNSTVCQDRSDTPVQNKTWCSVGLLSTSTATADTTTAVTIPKTESPTTEASSDASESTAAPSKPSPAPSGRHFDPPSFIGGTVLSLGLLAIVYVGFKFYKARTERNYHTL